MEKQTTHEKKVMVINSSLKPIARNAAAVSASSHQQSSAQPSNSSSSATPSRVNSTTARYCYFYSLPTHYTAARRHRDHIYSAADIMVKGLSLNWSFYMTTITRVHCR